MCINEILPKVLFIFGTRPEAIKLAPLISGLSKSQKFDVKVCVTAQHRQMLDQVLDLFAIKVDYDLNLMVANQDLTNLTIKILLSVNTVLKEYSPDLVIVQGDTTTTFAASLASFYEKIKVVHIEAGLRTFNNYYPWPEEMNRKLTAPLTWLHFAPTKIAANNLVKENIDSKQIFVVGNTVVDALLYTVAKIQNDKNLSIKLSAQFNFLDPHKKLILVTGHRRENFGKSIQQICQAISVLANRGDVQIVYPVHLNPNIKQPVHEILANKRNVFLLEPLDYIAFVYLMNLSYIILTDSGGIQEEAPSLVKPVLIMRNETERMEGVLSGVVKLVGTTSTKIISATQELLENTQEYANMQKGSNPYGDGKATERIINIIIEKLLP